MKPNPPSWWQDAYWSRRDILTRKFSEGEFYAIGEGDDEDLRFLTDNLQDAAEDFGGWWPPFIMGNPSESRNQAGEAPQGTRRGRGEGKHA